MTKDHEPSWYYPVAQILTMNQLCDWWVSPNLKNCDKTITLKWKRYMTMFDTEMILYLELETIWTWTWKHRNLNLNMLEYTWTWSWLHHDWYLPLSCQLPWIWYDMTKETDDLDYEQNYMGKGILCDVYNCQWVSLIVFFFCLFDLAFPVQSRCHEMEYSLRGL